jgi:hypothetical protein
MRSQKVPFHKVYLVFLTLIFIPLSLLASSLKSLLYLSHHSLKTGGQA